MKNLTELLQEKATKPLKNNGWHFDFGFIKQITERAISTGDSGEWISMEDVDAILLALFEF